MSVVLPRRLALRRQELEKVEDSITEFTQALTDTHKLLTGKSYEDLILNGEF